MVWLGDREETCDTSASTKVESGHDGVGTQERSAKILVRQHTDWLKTRIFCAERESPRSSSVQLDGVVVRVRTACLHAVATRYRFLAA